MRLPPDGHDVHSAIAIEVCDGQIFDGHAPIVDNVPAPLSAAAVHGLVDAHSAPLLRLIAQIIADADDQLVIPIAVEVGTPDSVPPFQFFIDDVPLPQSRSALGRWCVNNHLVAVPRLNRGDEGPAIL